jgi:hypothetical protein
MDVAAWLRGLGLEQYEPAFRDNFVDADVLPDLTAEDLVGLGVTAILFAAAQARGLMSPSLTALASILITISMLATPFLVRYGERWADSLPQIRGNATHERRLSWWALLCASSAYSGRLLAEGFNIAMRSVAQRHFLEAACTLIQLSWARFQRLWGPS